MKFHALALALLPLFTMAQAEVEEIIVTANRLPQTAKSSLAAVSVINRAQIEASQLSNVQEILRQVPGLTISNSGGAGKLSSVFLRGTGSDHVLVLVDGIKIGSATVGSAALQDFPLERIERIEVVRGPRASLYGSEAIGGVIQIFTRGGAGAKSSVTVGHGSNRTTRVDGSLNLGDRKAWLSAGVNHYETRGENAYLYDPNNQYDKNEPDRDGYRRKSGSLRGAYVFSPAARVEAQWLRALGRNDYDGYFNHSNTVQDVYGTTVHLGDAGIKGVVKAGRAKDSSDNFNNSTFLSKFLTQRDTLSAQASAPLGQDQKLIAGVDYLQDKVESSTAFSKTSRDNLGLYGQFLGQLDGHELQAALRSDDNQQFGRHQTGSLAWGLQVSEAVRLTANYGTAFKAPTFNDLYWPGDDWVAGGNPDLRPETSKTLELGVRVQTVGSLALHVYQAKIDDMLATLGFETKYKRVNLDEARIRGAELEYSYQLSGWSLKQSLSWLQPQNLSASAMNKVLPRRAKQIAHTELSKQFGGLEVGGSLHAQGASFDDVANSKRLPGYALLDLRASYAIDKNLKLQARVGNVFDTEYQTVYRYTQPSRSLFIGMNYQR